MITAVERNKVRRGIQKSMGYILNRRVREDSLRVSLSLNYLMSSCHLFFREQRAWEVLATQWRLDPQLV